MREVDRRSKYSRRIFLQGAAAAAPVVAVAASAGLAIEEAWADDANRVGAVDPENPGQGRARHLSARFPGRQLLHHRDQALGWQGRQGSRGQEHCWKTASRRLDQDARDQHNSGYAQVPWEADRVVLLQGIEQTDFFKKLRSDLVVSLYNQEEPVAEVRLRGLLPPTPAATSSAVSTTSTGCRKSEDVGQNISWEDITWQNSI